MMIMLSNDRTIKRLEHSALILIVRTEQIKIIDDTFARLMNHVWTVPKI